MNSKHQKLDPADLQEYLNGMRQALLDDYSAPRKIDRERVERSIRKIYIESGRAEPVITWFSNPCELQEAGRTHPADEIFRISQIEDKCGKKIRQILESSISSEDFNDAFTMLWESLPSREIQSLSWQARADFVSRRIPDGDQRMSLESIVASMRFGSVQNAPETHELEWASASLIRLAIAQLACEFFEVRVDETERSNLDSLLALGRSAHAYLCFENECMLSDPPLEFHLDEQFRTHHPTGPAVVYANDMRIFCWRGTRVPELAITCDTNLGVIESEYNIEIRRILIERYGVQQYLLDTGAEIRQHDKFGSLYVKEVRGDENIVMVHITNATPEPDGQYRTYFLRVPPTIRTALEAVAWTFGMTADEYDPIVES